MWKRGTVKGAKAVGNQYARNHDSILYYSRQDDYIYNTLYLPYSDSYIKERFTKDDNDGRGPYTDQAIGTRSLESILQLEADNRIFNSIWLAPFFLFYTIFASMFNLSFTIQL